MGPRLPTYAILIALEAALVLLVIRGNGPRWCDLLGDITTSLPSIARDAGLAAAMWVVWIVFSLTWQRIWPAPPNGAVSAMLPIAPVERIVWILLSCSAGFAEELAFRGALQRWVERKTASANLAIIIQAVIFGIVHGYQGVGAVLRIVVYGAFFGAVARWRRSLVPGMIAHAWTDIAAGLLRI